MMNGSLLRPWLLGCLVLAGGDLSAETTPVSPDGGAPGSLSPHLKAALAADGPAYRPVKPGPAQDAETPGPPGSRVPDGDVLVLPSFVVRVTRPPRLDEVLSLVQKMDRYLGPRRGFDRGVLNRIVLTRQFGALTVALFGAVKNEARAAELHFDDQRLRHRAELLDFSAILQEAGDTALGDRVKRESDDLYFRKPALKRK